MKELQDLPFSNQSEPVSSDFSYSPKGFSPRTLKIDQAIKTHAELLSARSDLLKNYDRRITWITSAVITIVVVYYNVFEAQICIQNTYNPIVKLDYFEASICSVLGFAFLAVGIRMVTTVRKYSS